MQWIVVDYFRMIGYFDSLNCIFFIYISRSDTTQQSCIGIPTKSVTENLCYFRFSTRDIFLAADFSLYFLCFHLHHLFKQTDTVINRIFISQSIC